MGLLNDLFVTTWTRGMGVAEGLIAVCVERCREHGATRLVWQTAGDNHRAQAVCARSGPPAMIRWLDYDLPVQPSDPAERRAVVPTPARAGICDLTYFGEMSSLRLPVPGALGANLQPQAANSRS